MSEDIAYLLKWRPFQSSQVFEFKDPDSGRIHTANNQPDLVRLIVSYRQQNGYEPIENLDAVLANYLCSLPINSGRCAPYFPITRGLWATLKGGVALVKTLLYSSFASQEEADRRSTICYKCPHNVFPDRSRFIKWSDSVAAASIGKRRSIHHVDLGNCAVCTCCLKAKVFYTGVMGNTPEQEEMMKKVNCWQVK